MKLELCPICGSSKTESDVLGVNAKCLACGWEGDTQELVAAKLDEDRLGIAEQVSKQYMALLFKKAALVVGQCMVESGLIGGREDKAVVARILKSAVTAAHKATLETMDQIQKEQHGIPTA